MMSSKGARVTISVFWKVCLVWGIILVTFYSGIGALDQRFASVSVAEEQASQPRSAAPWSVLQRVLNNIFASEDAFPVLPQRLEESEASSAPVYEAGTYDRGELRIVNQVPVLILRGKPEEIAIQEAKLTSDAIANLVIAPQEFLRQLNYPGGWEGLIARGRNFWRYVPENYRRELVTMAEAAGLNHDELFAINVLPDIYRSIACSSLIVLPERSATGKVLFGRNLDFFSPRQLYRYTIVKVYESDGGGHRFVSIGFPGFVGCLTGMNDAGLCLAVHEVHFTNDGSPICSPHGIPYAMMTRQIMEHCSNVEEAIAHLRKSPRTTLLNIALCDPKRAVVAEITPKTVAVREAARGLLACTNHFCTPELKVFVISRRYGELLEAYNIPKIDVATVQKKLDDVNLGFLSIQSVVFEPEDLVMHLSAGFPPVTKRPYHRLEMRTFLQSEAKASSPTISSR